MNRQVAGGFPACIITHEAAHPLASFTETPALIPVPDSVDRVADLPAFEKPPVIEVAASLQFAPIERLDAARLGLLWQVYRDRYPVTQQQPPLGQEVEAFGPPKQISLSFTAMSPGVRVWFLNEQGTRLLQVQQDRFVLNWRKLDTGERYPHYDHLRSALVEEFARFEEFLRSENLALPIFNQAELTYVNHIPMVLEGSRQQVHRIVRLWAGEPEEAALPSPEEVSFQSRYVMQGEAGPLGRLYITMDIRYRLPEMQPILGLQLVARGNPEGPGLAGALAFLDRGHEWIVQNFAAITTPVMHRVWERTR